VEYGMEKSNHATVVNAFFAVVCIVATFGAFIRWQNWCFRNVRIASRGQSLLGTGREGDGGDFGLVSRRGGGSGWAGRDGLELAMRGRDCSSLQRLLHSQEWAGLIILAHSWTLAMFAMLFSMCTVYTVLFKLQSRTQAAFLLLPPRTGYQNSDDNDYYFVWITLYTMAIAHHAFLAYVVYLQCAAEVFFVDMEVGRGDIAIAREAAAAATSQQAPPPPPTGPLPLSGEQGGADGAGTGGRLVDDGVSAWRRILIANEWSRLAATRRHSLELTLFLLVAVLVAGGLEHVALPQPTIGDNDPRACGSDEKRNLILGFASTTWWFIIIEFAQVCLNRRG
jgi:hypothetical protein